jgi:low affinity Fe/Cu permease
MNDAFRRAAHRISGWVGSPIAFLTAFAVVLAWAVSGPAFGFSDTWQLVINTSTTIVTFLMVFLIQNTQNRDSRALHLKLDDLILYTKGAENDLVDIENLSEDQLARAERRFHELARLLDKNGIAHEDGAAKRPRRPAAATAKQPARPRASGGAKGRA